MISVIIPIFNSQKYLNQCIESVIKQDFKDIEIILVNDGSTDNSLVICQDLKLKYKNIKLINNEKNYGTEISRFKGFELSQGDYIMYLDSDDWLNHKKVLSSMYRIAIDNDVDYVEIGHQKVLDKRKLIKKHNVNQFKGLITIPELHDSFFISFFGYNKLSTSMWAKLYKRSTIEKANIKSLGIFMQDDVAFNLQLFPYLKSIYIINDIGYNYRYGGYTTQYNNFIDQYKKLYIFKREMLEKFNLNKYLYYLNVEFKNILKVEIINRIIYKIETNKENLKYWVKKELNNPLYLELIEFYKHKTSATDSFTIALTNSDIDGMLNVCKHIARKNYGLKTMKRFLSRLLDII